MRFAVIAPEIDRPIYERAAAQANRLFEITHFVHDLTTTDGIDQLLSKSDEFDAVCMLAGSSISREQLQTTAAKGKHLLGNAALTTPDYLQWSQETWQAAGAHFSVAQPRRFTGYAETIQSELQAKTLGAPGLLRIHSWVQIDDSVSDHNQLWHSTQEEIDLAIGLFGGPPDSVYASHYGELGPPGGVLIHLGFESAMALINVALHPSPSFYTASLIGANGAVYADDHHNTNLFFKGKTFGLNVSPRVTNLSSWLRPQLEFFVNSTLSGEQDDSVREMSEAIKVGFAAVQSAAKRKVAKRIGDTYELQ